MDPLDRIREESERMLFSGMVAELSVTLMGVSRSLDLLANLASPLGTPQTDPLISFFYQLPALKEPPSRLRCALYAPYADDRAKGRRWDGKFKDALLNSGWIVRMLSTPPSINCLILDGETAVVGNPAFRDTGATPVFPPGTEMATTIVRHFESIWTAAASAPVPSELLYEDLLRPSLPGFQKTVLVIAQEAWNPILRHLDANPNAVFSLAPRRFEELVAELLAREGFEVYLTPSSRDGGCDVLAVQSSPVGKQLYSVECKRYSKERPVGVGLVRSLYGVVEQSRSTAGLLVTTSHFTEGALKFGRKAKWRLALKNYDDLRLWIRQHAGPFGSEQNGT